MIRKKLLFVDDRTKRIQAALRQYILEYDVTIATNVKEALRALAYENFDEVSLDHDLTGRDFEDPDSPDCGMEIVRYLVIMGWPEGKPKPLFVVHSTNPFAASAMCYKLKRSGFSVVCRPFGWKRYQWGVVAGAFDLLHPGYIRLLAEARDLCHRVTVLLHDKPGQVLPVDARQEVLLALKYVDDVIVYKTEEELTDLLIELHPDVRIVGSDHLDHSTRELPFPTHYHVRDHDWSETRLKLMVVDNYDWQKAQT